MAPGFYEEKDRQQGGISIESRQGGVTFFPFVSVSIAVKPITDPAPCKALEIAAQLSELKHQAKKTAGNSLFVERRGCCVGGGC
jgi:hypothetical protein